MKAFEKRPPQIINPTVTGSVTGGAQSHSAPPIQVSGQTTNWLISKLIGTPVYNAQDEQIGTIADLIMDPQARVTSVVISVGQYLGSGDRNVQVPLSTLRFPAGTTGSSGGALVRLGPERAVLNVTRITLQGLPPF
jgi:sporulation protein YlmC with PRC-barrel domain